MKKNCFISVTFSKLTGYHQKLSTRFLTAGAFDFSTFKTFGISHSFEKPINSFLVIALAFFGNIFWSCSNDPNKTKNDEFVSSVANIQLGEQKSVDTNMLFSSIDWINGKEISNPGLITEGYVRIQGWAIDPEKQDLAKEVFVLANGKLFTTKYFMEREDVAVALNQPKYKNCGFLAVIPWSEILQSNKEINLIILSQDRANYFSGNKIRIL